MFDSWLPESKDHLPLTWWKQHPIYLAAIIALVAAASMLVFAILGPAVMVSWFAFSVEGLKQGKVWTLLTYVLVNSPSVWTLLGCYLMWNFGEAIERHLGRRSFACLLLLLVLSSPVLIVLLHLAGAQGMAAAGVNNLEFAVFVAFATLYPRAKLNMILFTIDAWVLAAIFVGINALQWIAYRQGIMLLLLAVNVGAAYLFIRYEKGELRLPSFSFPKPGQRPRPQSRPARGAPTRGSSASSAPAGAAATPGKKTSAKNTPTVDEILDKISHQGMHSITPEERRILDKASEEMRKRR